MATIIPDKYQVFVWGLQEEKLINKDKLISRKETIWKTL